MENQDFAGKVALVTGGASGIGYATVRALARRGAAVVIADISPRGAAVAEEILAAGGKALFCETDATRESEVLRVLNATIETFGRLDFAHNNVGLSWGRGIEDITEDDWTRTIDLTLKAPWLCLKHEIPIMRRQGGGAIVNTASMAGVRALDVASIAYSSAKAGVIHMTKYAAKALAGAGIRVNSVSPGLVRTPAVERRFPDAAAQADLASTSQPIGRLVEPEEVGAAVVWLCSDEAKMVTGENSHRPGQISTTVAAQ